MSFRLTGEIPTANAYQLVWLEKKWVWLLIA